LEGGGCAGCGGAAEEEARARQRMHARGRGPCWGGTLSTENRCQQVNKKSKSWASFPFRSNFKLKVSSHCFPTFQANLRSENYCYLQNVSTEQRLSKNVGWLGSPAVLYCSPLARGVAYTYIYMLRVVRQPTEGNPSPCALSYHPC
jgi:hypothetical protein